MGDKQGLEIKSEKGMVLNQLRTEWDYAQNDIVEVRFRGLQKGSAVVFWERIRIHTFQQPISFLVRYMLCGTSCEQLLGPIFFIQYLPGV